MSEEKRHPVYAYVYTDKFQAVNAARALFAEVYDLLLKQGLTVELRPFLNEKYEIPQIHMLEGVELNDGSWWPLLSFNIETHNRCGAFGVGYTLEVKFDPNWNCKNVAGFDKLVTVSRNPKRTPTAMDPKSICEFVIKYGEAVGKRWEAIKTKEAQGILRQARLNKNEQLAKALRERPNKGRAHVFACQDNPVYGENEVWLQLRGTPEEIQRACELLDSEFLLPQTITPQE